ncbi:alpha/beta hydrolase [Georgenia yuyongxinii]|uniref:Alpha/beta hydrolase n=1 Tax=Georgenia yuyongxinii TaxID=2589797 RepID=A0A5B8C7B2_9MICO|nr:alpha/beta fold hydrolase [Georgenia yuyongxinii]QDC25042.1 alpha/beta hydrolase [Georgenia yuyongxinii]
MTSSQEHPEPVHVVLVPGFWLGAWAWEHVVPDLERAGLRPHPVTLPGLDAPSADRAGLTLADHVAALREVVVALDGPVVLVGHSGGAAPVSAVVDADPERIRRVVYVDAGPLPEGAAIMPDLPADAVDWPLPEWADLERDGTSVAGIDEDGLARFRERSVPEPAGVARAPSHLSDPRRKQVPTTVVCASMPAQVLRTAIDERQPWAAELADLAHLEIVELPTGHWPMFSRPADLSRLIVAAARR